MSSLSFRAYSLAYDSVKTPVRLLLRSQPGLTSFFSIRKTVTFNPVLDVLRTKICLIQPALGQCLGVTSCVSGSGSDNT
jgi:hypothetical protein